LGQVSGQALLDFRLGGKDVDCSHENDSVFLRGHDGEWGGVDIRRQTGI